MHPLIMVTSSVLAGLWFAGAWHFLISKWGPRGSGFDLFGPTISLRRLRTVLLVTLIGFGGTVVAAPSFWFALMNGYPGDSLFTLEPLEIVGVVAIALSLIFLFLWLLSAPLVWIAKSVAVAPLTRTATGIAALVGAGLVFGISFTVSPQIFYAFYRQIIPGLPDQWVIKTWLDWDRLSGAAALQVDGSLSAHLTGLAFWTVLILVCSVFAVRWKDSQWQASPIQVGGAAVCAAVLFQVL